MAHLPTALTLAAATALAASTPPQEGAGGADPAAPVQALDVLLFEDSTAEFALGGFRERRRVTDAPDVREVTSLFSGLEVEVDARAPVVDLGDGSKDSFDRLDALRVDLEGAIGVVEMRSLDPLAVVARPARRPAGQLGTSSDVDIPLPYRGVLDIAPMAAERGIAALLVAPPVSAAPFTMVEDVSDPHVIEWPSWGEPKEPTILGRDEIAARIQDLPLIRIRRHELDLIRERLRARRVRGADGETETIRVGPGPVEAHVVVARGAGAAASAD